MTLDRKIDRAKLARQLKIIDTNKYDELQAAAGRNIVKELKRAGVWDEWTEEHEEAIN